MSNRNKYLTFCRNCDCQLLILSPPSCYSHFHSLFFHRSSPFPLQLSVRSMTLHLTLSHSWLAMASQPSRCTGQTIASHRNNIYHFSVDRTQRISQRKSTLPNGCYKCTAIASPRMEFVNATYTAKW